MAQDNVALAPDTGDDFDLSPLERRFAEEYFGGEFAHIGTRSYMAASPSANYNTASVEASRFLRIPRVQNYLRELHRRALDAFSAEYVEWKELIPLAQQVIRAHAEGRLKNTLALVAADKILDRAIGKPKQPLETDIGMRMDQLIRDLAAKRQPPGHRFVPPGHGLPPVRKPDVLDATFPVSVEVGQVEGQEVEGGHE